MPIWLIESLKELLRVVVLAIVPVVIVSVENGAIDWKVVATVGGVAALRFIDKLLHNYGKENETTKVPSPLTGGLTRF